MEYVATSIHSDYPDPAEGQGVDGRIQPVPKT